MNFIDTLKMLVPLLVGAIPGGDKYVSLIVAGMSIAEESTKHGKDKKELALKSIRIGAMIANLIAKHTVVDPDKAVRVAESVIDQVVELVNNNLDLKEDVEEKNKVFVGMNSTKDNANQKNPVQNFDDLLGDKK